MSFDHANAEPWQTETNLTDPSGNDIGNVFSYDTADTWLADHSLTNVNLWQFDNAAAENLTVSVERGAYQGDVWTDGTPSPFSFDPYFGAAYDFTAGTYNVDVGAYDFDPYSFDTSLDYVDSGFGYDDSGLDYWNDADYYDFSDYYESGGFGDYVDYGDYGGGYISDFGDEWTYESGYDFGSYDYTGWGFDDAFAPVVLDLNGDGVDITPRTDSTVYFDADDDGYWERVAWAGPQDGLLVIDLAEDGSYGPDGYIDQLDEVAFYAADPNVNTDLEALASEQDTNHDGFLTSADAHWADFRVWKDANQDGYDDPGEVVTLSSLGITSISLTSDHKSFLMPDDTLINGFSSFTMNGTSHALADASLAYDPDGFYEEDDPGVGFTYYGEDGSVMPFQDAYDLGTYNVATNYALDDRDWAGALGGALNDTFSVTNYNGLGMTFFGDAGNDTLNGGPGDDELDGGTGADAIYGGAGDDTIYFESGDASVNGGDGYDTGILTSTGGINLSLYSDGLESLIANQGADNITANTIVGAYVDGRAGNDAITGSYYDDILVGGTGGDTIHANPGVDMVMGGAGADTLYGDDGDDTIFAGDGNDILNGGAGNDTLHGEAGADGLTGGAGNDTFFVDNPADAVFEAIGGGSDKVLVSVSYALTAGQEIETLTTANAAGTNPISLTGNAFANVLQGNAGDNILNGGAGADTLTGGRGNDTYYIDTLSDAATENAGEGADTVRTAVSGYVLPANIENGFVNTAAGSALTGNGGLNTLIGNSGGDTLNGGAGNDALRGKGGADTLTGGAGADRFFYASGDGADIVTDFTAGAASGDQVALAWSTGMRSFSDVLAHATQAGVDTVLDFGGGDTIKLNNVAKTALVADDFMLQANPPPSDFNADGNSDLLWQNDDGRVAIWEMNGTNVADNPTLTTNPGPSWHTVATGDFNADGHADILWQNDSGAVSIWEMSGASVLANPTLATNPGPSWHTIDTGDFNGDGKSDILWQNDNGAVSVWEMDGAAVLSNPTLSINPGPSWHTISTGDFNADGHADILWQNDNGAVSIWEMNGANVISNPTFATNPGPSWHAIDAGDFNADNKSDILWQNDNGAVSIWEMDGASVVNNPTLATNPGPSWHTIRTDDFNIDGKADIAWQNDNGAVSLWEMDGTNVLNNPTLSTNPGSSWHVIGPNHVLTG